MRLQGKVGIVIGAGQSPGETVGTGRAAAIVFAREGAKVLLADRDIDSARETAAIIAAEGGVAECVAADWTDAADCRAVAQACVGEWGRIDFLQNNVGIGAGDADPLRLTEDVFDHVIAVNLKGCLLACQAIVPVMREQGSGSVVNISSIASIAASVPLTAYRISKMGVNVLSHSLAIQNAAHGVRVNTIASPSGELSHPLNRDIAPGRAPSRSAHPRITRLSRSSIAGLARDHAIYLYGSSCAGVGVEDQDRRRPAEPGARLLHADVLRGAREASPSITQIGSPCLKRPSPMSVMPDVLSVGRRVR